MMFSCWPIIVITLTGKHFLDWNTWKAVN